MNTSEDNQVLTLLFPTSEEEDLTAIIQHQWTSDEQERYSYLVKKLETEALTEVEHSELMTYADQAEREGIGKIKALVKLAKLRQVNPSVLLKELLPETSHAD